MPMRQVQYRSNLSVMIVMRTQLRIRPLFDSDLFSLDSACTRIMRACIMLYCIVEIVDISSKLQTVLPPKIKPSTYCQYVQYVVYIVLYSNFLFSDPILSVYEYVRLSDIIQEWSKKNCLLYVFYAILVN